MSSENFILFKRKRIYSPSNGHKTLFVLCVEMSWGAENSIDTLGGNKLPCLSGCAVEFAWELVESIQRQGVTAAAQDANAPDKAQNTKEECLTKTNLQREKFAYE